MLNFAILSAGNIAEKMARTLADMPAAVNRYAVAARDGARAAALAQKYGFAHSYGSYAELFADPAVDIVYIATTNNLHAQHVRDALNAGKHVLCEKPLTTSGREARSLFALARAKGLVLTEAVWTRFQPFVAPLREAIESGEIGRPVCLTAALGSPMAEKARIALPELAGGVLLDIGIYALTIADLTLGAPCCAPVGVCRKNENGMDTLDTIVLQYAGGQMASLIVSGHCRLDNRATLYGTNGRIEVAASFWYPQQFTVYAAGAEPRVVSVPFEVTGYEYEVRAMARAVSGHLGECPEMPPESTLRIMDQMDALRKSWGIVFPFE